MTSFLMCVGVITIFILAIVMWFLVPRLIAALALTVAMAFFVFNSGTPLIFQAIIFAICVMIAFASLLVQMDTFKEDLKQLTD